MPFFRVTVERHVSRRVELRQTATVFVEAVDDNAAREAVREIAHDDELYEYVTAWTDEDDSRQASNDEVERKPELTASVRTSTPWRENWLPAMPPKEVPNAE